MNSAQSLSPLLAPVKSPRLGGKVDEYRLVGEPSCLQEIFDFLHCGKRAIWTSPKSCIYLKYDMIEIVVPPSDFGISGGHLVFFDMNTKKSGFLKILSRTRGDKLDCFELLIRLSDAYSRIHMYSFGPISTGTLKTLQDGKLRTISFSDERFSADCGRLLATGGSRTHLVFFRSCRFEDRGKAFANALSQRQDESKGPSEVSLVPNELFDPENRRKFLVSLQQASLQNFSLTLSSQEALDEEASRLIALVKIRMLVLKNVRMSDDGEAFAASIRRGHGPRGLNICHSHDVLRKILAAVGDERCSVKKLIIEHCNVDDESLAAALHGNKRLYHMELRGLRIKTQPWKQLLGAISTHPTLRSLRLPSIKSSDDETWMDDVIQDEGKTQRTEEVVAMLTTNHLVNDIEFCPTTFDGDMWDKRVVPLLECNRWRENIFHLWRVEPESTRASLLAMCLAQVSSNPSTVTLLLSCNQGLIASYATHYY